MSSFWRFLTVLILAALKLVPYVGVGFLCYAYFVDAHIDTGSAWFWGYLLMWPLVLFLKFFLYVAGAVALVVALVVGYLWGDEQWNAYQARKRRAKREAESAERKRARGIIEH